MLILIHPNTGDVISIKRGETELAVIAWRDGYRGLSERTNNKLSALAAVSA